MKNWLKPFRPLFHIFRGRKYLIRWRAPKDTELIGTCENPCYKKPVIEIHPGIFGLEKLITLVDEFIHACQFDLDNEVVGEMSFSIGTALWECGLRFKDEIINQAMEDKPLQK